MKNLKLMKALSLAEDKYIEEANPKRKKASLLISKKTFVAACLCLIVTGLNLWLFMPHKEYIGDISAYTGSEYYSIIEKLNVYGITPPKYTNNFMMLFDGLTRNFLATKEDNFAPESGTSQEYKEVTDNQVAGVIEGDRIKRSDKYAKKTRIY